MADVRELDVSEGRSLYSRVAGVFLFLPFLLEAGFEATGAARRSSTAWPAKSVSTSTPTSS
jgi:hypothetical protein